MTLSDRFDVVVIGGGHNGLVCAAVLAKAGCKVLVLEAERQVGGAARTEEFAPGFQVSLAHVLNRIHPEVVRALDLQAHGLKLSRSAIAPTTALAPDGPLILHGAYGERLEGTSAAEASAWQALRAQLIRHAGILKPLLARRPPDLKAVSLAETAGLGMAALNLRRLGKNDMRDFLRMLLTNVADVLDEHLADERLRGLLAFDATLGSRLGARSPSSLLGLYYRLTGDIDGAPGGQVIPVGGMGAVCDAIARAAESLGVTVRLGEPVRRISVRHGRATAVVLSSGERIAAGRIVSAINPRTTFLDLVGPRELDTGFVRAVGNIRMRGTVAKVHLALDRRPLFPSLGEDLLRGRLVFAPSCDHVERAFNPAKYGELSPDPVMEVTIPSAVDESFAPRGCAVLSAMVQFAPYDLRQGWESGRPRLLQAVMNELERYSPGIGASLRQAEILSPVDIEARYRMPGGHWHHGELQPDQMLISRPVFGASGYDTPVDGLYLAGAGSHPGGGVSGLPGLNAARRILAMEVPANA